MGPAHGVAWQPCAAAKPRQPAGQAGARTAAGEVQEQAGDDAIHSVKRLGGACTWWQLVGKMNICAPSGTCLARELPTHKHLSVPPPRGPSPEPPAARGPPPAAAARRPRPSVAAQMSARAWLSTGSTQSACSASLASERTEL